MESQDYWLALNRVRLAPRVTLALLQRFGSPEAVLEADFADLVHVSGVGEKSARRLLEARGKIDLSAHKRLIEQLNVELVTYFDERYPPHLRDIYDPPPLLFLKGTLLPVDEISVSIVGTRKASPYAQARARQLARGFAEAGATVVSGLAVGCDAAAHWGALEGKGRTVGFLACGIDVEYPRPNRALLERIPQNGALLSEYPLGTPPRKEIFQGRNRLISGFSLATVVVEAPERSGALITADHALDHGKHVFVVAGDEASPTALGSNTLLREGAIPVESAEDALQALGVSRPPKTGAPVSPPRLAAEEQDVYGTLTNRPQYLDEIVNSTRLPAQVVGANLVLLELKGLAKRLPGGLFVRG